MENISKHISFDEATKSQTATRHKIDNTPSVGVIEAMELVAEKCFEPLREWWGKPLTISSFFRCEKLNKKIGGSPTSQHVKGEAIDIDTGNKQDNVLLFDWLKNNVEFDQLINEYDYSWVHVSYSKKKNRKQILIVK
jgi:hypothetical protein